MLGLLWPKYLTDWAQCPQLDPERTAEREMEMGAFVAGVEDVTVGAFTAPNVQQELYRVYFGPCSWGGEDNLGRLVVLQDGVLVAKAKADANLGLRVVDIEGDGQNELVIKTAEMGGPRTTRTVRFKNGEIETVKQGGVRVTRNAAKTSSSQ